MASSRVTEVNSDKHFDDELRGVPPSQLVIADFFATWCGPCHWIAPKFAEFSQKFQHVKFLKVDVDKCRSTVIQHGIKAMPTFVFFRNGIRIEEVSGADIDKLETAIKFHAGDSNEPSSQNIAGRSFPCFKDLVKNEKSLFLSACSTLLKIANNILKDPDDLKYRQIKVGNRVFVEKLLPVSGAVECLFAMGFQDMDDKLFLPRNSPLDDMHAIRDALLEESFKIAKNMESGNSKSTSMEENISEKQGCTSGSSPVIGGKTLHYLPILNTPEKNKFFHSVISSIEQVLLYEEAELLKLARNEIPLENLYDEAEKDYQRLISMETTPSLDKKDCLLLSLLAWFKNSFFSWANSPKCHECGQDTKYHSNDSPNLEEKKWKCGNVECYECVRCKASVRFPRYNHPQKLLKTRTGRCGEWANCFTLCCRAVGFEARYVLDLTDHVWTEVYSEHQKRWLHCDSCENICDKPLIYENGWGKKLSYVIAFSKEEVIDVTWRYSSSHKDVISRRVLVPEAWLFHLCQKATKELQSSIKDEQKISIMISRNIVEIVEFLTPKSKSREDEQGRISGSLTWRQARGEVGSVTKSYIFEPSEDHTKRKRFRVRYLPARDCYNTSLDNELVSEGKHILHGWENGVESSEKVFRKVEHDWKKVYLARVEDSEIGLLKWKFNAESTNLEIAHVSLKIKSDLFQDGQIDLKLCSENNCQVYNKIDDISTDSFKGSKSLHMTISLKGGTGNVAWQHAQLFRCDLADLSFVGLDMDILLKDQ